MLSRVTAKNVGDVYFETQCIFFTFIHLLLLVACHLSVNRL